MSYDTLSEAAEVRYLTILGGFHPTEEDGVPEGTQTLLMLGPDEPRFWPAMTSSAEWQEGTPDPVDRWSERVITDWAEEIGAVPLFPFGGAPYLPFFSWATRTGRVHASPILLLVHDHAGLFVSFRGALALPDRLALPARPPNPCDGCAERPCLSSCPVDALQPEGYDVPACRTHIRGEDLGGCLGQGCAARRACPVSRRFGRLPAQSAYHMERFLHP
ncbi:ferredoxin [Aestuariivita sp.]|jgi:ferredoxin|uniref:ferredoxin n=1 Tax=Aestuariivita sp. TaxID=1872407 RepID=UPI00216EB3B8|nr:ferredoxin [Aestuariivita sp.]MCE8006651.1 ferredoxin [Aestuariivita sp.]